MLFSALPGFAQSWTANLDATLPTFVALDTVGGTTYLYVSEHGDVPTGGAITTNGGQILKYNLTAGGAATVIANHGTGNGQFISPDAIVVDPSTHNLFIADRYQNRVTEITNTGTYVMSFGSGTVGAADEMHGPVGLARDSAGAIYVTEHGDTNTAGVAGNMVSKYTISGTTATRVWRKGNGLNVPYSVSYNAASNRLYISDGFNHQVQVWDTDGNPIGSFPTAAIALGGSFDASGNFWMGEAGSDFGAPQQITKFNGTTGAVMVSFGTDGSGNGQFALPFDVAVNTATNTAYVADYHHNRVQVINLAAAPVGSAPVINSSATASGTVGQSFSYQVTATNSPTSFAAADALPAGLTLNTTTGVISGTPTTAGNLTTHLTATNSSGTSAQFALSFAIAAAPASGGTPAAPLGPTVTSFDLDIPSVVQGDHADMIVTFDTDVTGVDASDFSVNTQGSATASVTGVTAISAASYRVHFNYTDADGSIQMGIKSSGTGITGGGNAFRGSGYTATPVYGTGVNKAADQSAPTATLAAGAASGNDATFTVTFNEPVTGVSASDFIVTGTSATVGTPTGSGTTWSVPVTASGSGTVTLTLSGGPTANVRDAATNWFRGEGSTSASVTIAGSGGASAPTIANQTANGTQNAAFSYQVSASGATSFSIQGTPALPAGLSISTSGLITGTPTASGTTTVTVRATNATGSTDAQLTINIAAAGSAPTIANQTANGTQNVALSYQVIATGATSFSVVGSPALPAGLTMSSSGLITGTPTASGTTTVTVRATNATGSTNAQVTINVAAVGSFPTIASQSANGTQNAAFSYQVVASGATSFSVVGSPALPAGLTMSSSGLITGTPTASGTTTVTVRATNATGSTNAALTINIAAAGSAPTISNQTANGTQNSAFSYQVQASGATSFSLVSGSLPAGLSMNAAGVISGTPTASGTSTVTVRATNAIGSADASVTLTFAAYVPPPAGTPVVTSASMTLTSGIPMSYTVQVTNSPTSFTLAGAPGGLSISKTGVISGTPIATSTYNATVTATNAIGTGTGTLTFTINPSSGGGGGGPVKKGQTVLFSAPVSAVFVGDTFKLAAQTDSGLPVSYAIISGNATVSGDTLLVTGSGPVVVRATQPGSATYLAASADITIDARKRAQSISTASVPSIVHTDSAYLPSVSADSGLPITYSVVSGPATIENGKVVFNGTGTVVVRATQAGNAMYDGTTSTFTLTANPVPRLINISSRLKVSSNDSNGASIAGFWVTGDTPKQILVRAVGPGLSTFGINSPLANPTLKLYDGKGTLVATNSGWNNDAKITAAGDGVSAFRLANGSKDAAILMTLQPGAYTAQVQSSTNSGTVLIEIYDVTANAAVPTKQLINISTRGYVGTGDDVLIGGFAVSGMEPKKVLIRAVGPTLASFNVSGTLSDPVLSVYNASGTVVARNDNWGTAVKVGSETPATAAEITAANTATGAFGLANGSKDSAVIMTLQPGQYSAVVTGAGNATGSAMVEIYEIPNP